MISALRTRAAAICLATAPWVAAASPAPAAFIESQLSGERTVPEIRRLLVRESLVDVLMDRGMDETSAVWWADHSLEADSLQAWLRGEPVDGAQVRDDVWTVWRQAGTQQQLVFARVVGVNVPGVMLLLLPLAVAAAVLAASGGSGGAILGGAVLVGLIFVLLANPDFLFGER